jgi:hypothetical protein
MSARSIPVLQLLRRVVVVNSVNVSVMNSRFAALRRRRQCQRGQAPSRSFYITIVIVNVNIGVLNFPSRSFCSFIDAVSVIVSDHLQPRSVYIAIVVYSVNVCSINSRFAASSATSIVASLSA